MVCLCLRSPDSDILDTVFIKYNPGWNFLCWRIYGQQCVDIGMKFKQFCKSKSFVQKFAIDESFFGIQSIANVWMSHPEFDQIMLSFVP